MGKIKALKQEINECTQQVYESQVAYEQAKRQFKQKYTLEKLYPILCVATFGLGILHAISPRFRRAVNKTTKLAAKSAWQNGIVLDLALNLLKPKPPQT